MSKAHVPVVRPLIATPRRRRRGPRPRGPFTVTITPVFPPDAAARRLRLARRLLAMAAEREERLSAEDAESDKDVP